MFAMGGTRTHHRLTCGIEDAGFLIRDELCWVYLQGFPKAQDLAMLIEKKLGGEGEVVGKSESKGYTSMGKDRVEQGYREHVVYENGQGDIRQPTLPAAQKWSGWKTPALKPAFEPIVVAQKPCEGSITENVMKYGVGGFNIEACRIPYENEGEDGRLGSNEPWKMKEPQTIYGGGNGIPRAEICSSEKGRYPANVMMTEPCFDIEGNEIVKANEKPATGHVPKIGGAEGLYDGGWKKMENDEQHFQNASFSKFFIIPKADTGEKENELDELQEKSAYDFGSIKKSEGRHGKNTARKNIHPTVKPILLMEHLLRLVARPDCLIIDPFMGSGTTLLAAKRLGMNAIGIEKDPEYFEIAEKRIRGKQSLLVPFDLEAIRP
jgi:site-specific DNA-methyltransferase (adenine-specific)